MRYALHEHDVTPEGSAAGVKRLFDADRGCPFFSQRLLTFAPGVSESRTDPSSDEVLYVLAGSARAYIDGHEHDLKPGTSAFVARGTTWSVAATDELVVCSVLVHDPPEAAARHAVVDLAAEELDDSGVHGATAGRQFILGADPQVGCTSVTQFVGLIPPGRAPDHFHTYDEVIYVLQGEGELHIGGEQAPLRPGSCVHLPNRLVHCLANIGSSEMRVLGVFRPAGSPAEAYYPDGTLAMPPERS